MPWELEIHTIDVGQGESSLIIARHTTPPLITRSMLIDGGLAGYAQTIHNYIVDQGLESLDFIVVSHYDQDHSGGIIALLRADNLYHLYDLIATPIATRMYQAANNGTYRSRPNQIAAGVAVGLAVMHGAYDGTPTGGANQSNFINPTYLATQANNLNGFTDAQAFIQGCQDFQVSTYAVISAGQNPTIVRGQGPYKGLRGSLAKELATAGAEAIGLNAAITLPALIQTIRDACLAVYRSSVPVDGLFTNGLYRTTTIIDIGNTIGRPAVYPSTIMGEILMNPGRAWIQVPSAHRPRISSPTLGSELFWGGAAPNTPNAPLAFVMACNQFAWNNTPQGAGPINGGQAGNDVSIALIINFNNFSFFTGGDLPSQGENLIANYVSVNGLPAIPGGGGAIPAGARRLLAAFKCGHHGSQHSTSDNFLNRFRPRLAIISCGVNQFGTGDNHPAQKTITRLQTNTRLIRFYLTNCKYATNFIPASEGNPQIQVANNKSRVAGDNDNDNLKVNRPRGNIIIRVLENQSLAAANPLRQFQVTYWEHDDQIVAGVKQPNTPIGYITEAITF